MSDLRVIEQRLLKEIEEEKGFSFIEDGVTVTKENQEFIEEMMRWRNYGGGQ